MSQFATTVYLFRNGRLSLDFLIIDNEVEWGFSPAQQLPINQITMRERGRLVSKQLIAIIDDSVDYLNATAVVFRSLGRVRTFERPQEFLDTLRNDLSFRPDLVVTDYTMPTMTGLQMITSARDTGVLFPTILVSGYINKETAISAANFGVCRILEKPVSKTELLSASRLLLAQHSAGLLRTEMREVNDRLRELFNAFRVVCIDELKLKNAPRVELTNFDGLGVMSLDDALVDLEARLDKLNHAEESLMFLLNNLKTA